MVRLADQGGTLAKLSLTGSRVADFRAWAQKTEKELFDLASGPFRRTGKLLEFANAELKQAWETGDVETMDAFLKKHPEQLVEPSPDRSKTACRFRKWPKRFAQWLYSSDQINVSEMTGRGLPGIAYDLAAWTWLIFARASPR